MVGKNRRKSKKMSERGRKKRQTMTVREKENVRKVIKN